MDSSLADALVSNNSIIDTQSLKVQIGENCTELGVGLEEKRMDRMDYVFVTIL